jgi:outer membrane protein assembly factor BamD (BamD/ComL family)
VPPEASAVTAPPEAGSSPEASAKTMDLANQNVLFAEAKLARQQGDQARAVRLLEDLVRRYPSSPLSEDARVETFRALAQLGDRAGAAREARRYLALYHSGFARDEARNLALAP